ncbi:winged helix-turn-helix domain-containing protein [uncultured Chitinophaga sp.]|jgi:Response regulators consisting of a CheY-like receiver domain and a winged-helix DNA-binding domain|uniref:winged helix-turn-helix domain-containing protein n=1 Tax=uncultured Chitinophaga sp. TaxID=339340 RepID=UPI00262F29ED|nr:winged helix-turn-helix domain-containing protein [uncultured Chitinophaga sp.]
MKPYIRNLLSGKRKYVGALSLLLLISIIGLAFSMAGGNDYEVARREILLRRIGHEVLLQSGDSTSRVLPVKKIAENEYQISFENNLTFQTGHLVNTTRRLLSGDPLATDYVVNVLSCADGRVAYGYAISKDKKNDIVTCLGRKQPKACYMINIKFNPTAIITTKTKHFLGGLAFLALVGFTFWRPAREQEDLIDRQDTDLADNQHTDLLKLGAMSFDTAARKLMADGKTIELTRTETRVLRIFALAPNEVIERSRLQKEIWEDEGVIVGRSLDMFISKLRKKLELDQHIRIVVIRGKGYKLEISG